MDNINLFIIAVSVILAILFKWYLFRRIRHWMDQDLIRALAGQDAGLQERLMEADLRWRGEGVTRTERHRRLEQLARDPEPER